MTEGEVFEMLQKIDTKLDRFAECRVDDLKMINSALETKVDKETFEKTRQDDLNLVKWLVGGIAAALMLIFSYTYTINADVKGIATKLDMHTQPVVADQKGVETK